MPQMSSVFLTCTISPRLPDQHAKLPKSPHGSRKLVHRREPVYLSLNPLLPPQNIHVAHCILKSLISNHIARCNTRRDSCSCCRISQPPPLANDRQTTSSQFLPYIAPSLPRGIHTAWLLNAEHVLPHKPAPR
ncbi:hypothetical protein K466DRAFT_592705 [Polyporus arcularius HHB13444]|uniref:Uncharacterized protein n=1 Tax=Polyporus arcularius HHB13444 TaxID=1314778 RepID=A0A5C3NNF9_9APHY|nr:hypothetical protein K466DRAFT_592705 [Polyporus arcularius HHB13444]